MEEKEAYHCKECGKYKTMDQAGEEVPECCGKRMEKMPLTECVKDPAFAEHARFDDDDEPCDIGLSGDL